MDSIVADVTALSSKGQVVLPKQIRESLSLEAGAKFIVITDGDNILLKPIVVPSLEEFNELLCKTREWAKEVGMKESDISDAIREVRKGTR